MPVRYAVGGFFFHLRQHVPDDFGIGVLGAIVLVVGVVGAADDSDEAELRPGEGVVEVVFEKVVFGQVGDVAGLDGGEEGEVGWVGGEGDDVDHFGFFFGSPDMRGNRK